MIDTKFVDSSVWLAYFLSSDEKARELIEREGILYTSVLSLFEIRRKLLKINIDDARIFMILDFVRKRSLFISVTEEICINAALQKLPAVDAIIYVSAMQIKSKLFTYDNDFRGLDNVTIVLM